MIVNNIQKKQKMIQDVQEKILKIKSLREKVADTQRKELDAMAAKLEKVLKKMTREMSRIEVIQLILNAIKGKTYLEIGIQNGDCFPIIQSQTRIGIDPIPPVESVKKILDKDNTFYYQMKSDEFFEKHSEVFREKKLDVAFVDGLHTCEQALKDINHCLKHLNDKGVIILHDCNPAFEVASLRAFSLEKAKDAAKNKDLVWTGTWSGDVWKTVVELRSLRRDLRVFVLKCDCGLGIITKGAPESMLKYKNEDIQKMIFSDLDADRIHMLNLKPQEYLFDFLEEFPVV